MEETFSAVLAVIAGTFIAWGGILCLFRRYPDRELKAKGDQR
jgi:hypothetical protein